MTSDVSRAWPISDAGLGATAYLIEVLMGFMGDERRWRTMPWMVTFFGILVVPLGVTSIVLVILQPVTVGAFCTLCLIAALAMLVMIPLALDEVFAMLQFLVRSRREGKSVWRTFWLGGNIEEQASPGARPASWRPAGMVWGAGVPWALVASAVLGAWMMAAPVVLGASGAAADSDWLVGPLVTTISVIAMAEVARPLRWLNAVGGLWLVFAPWVLQGATTGSTWNDVLVGIALVSLSVPRGRVRERWGTFGRDATTPA